MRERGDLKCFHEPFMYDYYVHRQVRTMPHFNAAEDHPVSYQRIREMLLREAQQSNVFIKDMSYYVYPQIATDTEFNNRLTNCFIIRDPMASIVSYAKLDEGFTLEETGIEAQWQHFCAIENSSGKTPVVINATDVRKNPQKIIGKLFDSVKLPNNDSAFQWTNNAPEDWQQVSGWHGKAINTTSIQPPSAEKQSQLQQSFESLCTSNPAMKDYYDHHLPFYQLLNKHALT